jgi:formylglycine-generating enzyme required for sulfatase activity
MKTTTAVTGLVIAASVFSSLGFASVAIDWVTVGNSGNAADPTTGYGAVGYEYKIGKYEVTYAQYAVFLNAKGQSNANGIYNSNMLSYGVIQSGTYGNFTYSATSWNHGIIQSGISGNFTYSVTSGSENKPVDFVSWFEAARFCNWLHECPVVTRTNSIG